jgi:hypothetical protein
MIPARSGSFYTTPMTGLKQFIRPAILVSIIGHVVILAMGLHLVGAHPSQTIPPDAMVIDIVPSDEAPRFEGTPSDLHKSGSQMQPRPGNANTDARPPPKPAPQSPQQEQQPSKHQDEARKATQPLQAPEAAEAEILRSEMAQVQASQPPSAPPQPSSEATPDQPDIAERLAQLAMMGGALGGGFAAPAVNTNRAGYDFTLQFRERVSSCSDRAAGLDPGDRLRVVLRVSLNRDGTLVSTPQLLEPITSAKERAVMQSAINALTKCQPYTMLPADKYKQWKTLDLVFYPMNFTQ